MEKLSSCLEKHGWDFILMSSHVMASIFVGIVIWEVTRLKQHSCLGVALGLPENATSILWMAEAFLVVFAAAFGFILFKGIYEKRLSLLKCWTVYYGFCWAVQFLNFLFDPYYRGIHWLAAVVINYFYVTWSLAIYVQFRKIKKHMDRIANNNGQRGIEGQGPGDFNQVQRVEELKLETRGI